jgi:hypothetical protein
MQKPPHSVAYREQDESDGQIMRAATHAVSGRPPESGGVAIANEKAVKAAIPEFLEEENGRRLTSCRWRP